jgi:hypothetical protein
MANYSTWRGVVDERLTHLLALSFPNNSLAERGEREARERGEREARERRERGERGDRGESGER